MMVYHTKRGVALMSFLIMVNSNPGEKRPVRTRPLALPLGALSPQVTERGRKSARPYGAGAGVPGLA